MFNIPAITNSPSSVMRFIALQSSKLIGWWSRAGIERLISTGRVRGLPSLTVTCNSSGDIT